MNNLSFPKSFGDKDDGVRTLHWIPVTSRLPKETKMPVTDVPILAPIITVMDCMSVSNPAFTKLITITVVAEDDWMMDVINKPVSTALMLQMMYAELSTRVVRMPE